MSPCAHIMLSARYSTCERQISLEFNDPVLGRIHGYRILVLWYAIHNANQYSRELCFYWHIHELPWWCVVLVHNGIRMCYRGVKAALACFKTYYYTDMFQSVSITWWCYTNIDKVICQVTFWRLGYYLFFYGCITEI
jgi:hypothetical protein